MLSDLQLLRSGDLDITFIFTARKDKSVMATNKLRLGQTHPHNMANTPSALTEHLHRQHANKKLAKNPE